MQGETELIQRCKRGNFKAQKALYKKFAPKMYAVCLRYLKNTMDAEDVLQEGFISVFTQLDKYSFTGSFEGWIRRIMINQAINHYRKNLRLNRQYDLEIANEVVSVDFDIFDKLSSDEILNLIQNLPNGYRLVFNLYVIEGYSHKEIGELLNCSESTSKSQLSRARAHLCKMVQPLFEKIDERK